MGYRPRYSAAVVAHDFRVHRHQHATVPVITILDETVAYICGTCHERVRPYVPPDMRLDADPATHVRHITWLDHEPPPSTPRRRRWWRR